MLNLKEQYQEEWPQYVKLLRTCGFSLLDSEYTLVWSWNTKNWVIIAKLAYDLLLLIVKMIFSVNGGSSTCGDGLFL